MSSTQGNLAKLSRFVFKAPSWYSTVFFSILIAAMAGIASFDSLYVLEDAWQGVFYIGVPTVLAAFLTPAVDRFFGGELTANQSSLLALVCEMIVVALMTLGGVFVLLAPGFGQNFIFDVLVVALASIFAVRLFVLRAVSGRPMLLVAAPAFLQTFFGAAILFVYSGTMRYLEFGGPLLNWIFSRPQESPAQLSVVSPEHFSMLILSCVLYAGAVRLFIAVIDRPWKQSMGVSVLDFVQGFVGHVTGGSQDLEDFFEEIGEEAVVPVKVLSFATDEGEKARFVLPLIHPGPMGSVGAGNVPEMIARRTEGLAFVPHATAGHDMNPVTQQEAEKLVEGMERAAERIEHRSGGTRSVRRTGREVSVVGQRFGEMKFLSATFSPGKADDIEIGAGLPAEEAARCNGGDVMLADAHNCLDGLRGGSIPHVTPASGRAADLRDTAAEAGEALEGMSDHEIELGVDWQRTGWEPEEGIGALGIRTAAVEAEDHTTAYVVVDGNNMVPGLRERIVQELGGKVDEMEVMTTDTHEVTEMDAENQVGRNIDTDALVAEVEKSLEGALEDLEPVRAGSASETVEIRVFGNDRTEMLASHANAMVSMGAGLAGAFTLSILAMSALIWLLA